MAIFRQGEHCIETCLAHHGIGSDGQALDDLPALALNGLLADVEVAGVFAQAATVRPHDAHSISSVGD
ncbi:hypothetical protein [Amycolatopsis sp. La24]|uniref:hypothetical protein n=1 Tax=Amycolatopsis sp. La24 TaxID=3028304 RepID=UPI0023B101B2|nr:hypothetical protein [Amycolatopsis sp. La24]